MNDVHQRRLEAILASPSYRLAEEDVQFLKHADLRPVRMQLELLKVELFLNRNNIESTVVVFGSTQVLERPVAEAQVEVCRAAVAAAPEDEAAARRLARAERVLDKCHYYDAARKFCRLISEAGQSGSRHAFVVTTGGGPGIMEAANRGAFDAGAKTVGLNITLPEEQVPNPYITPELCFNFHYFAIRKMHFLMRARALVVFPGGFGTLDELFDALTLRQTRRMQAIPILLFGREYWQRVIDFQFLADEGVVADEHLRLFQYTDSPQEACDLICRFHENPPPEF